MKNCYKANTIFLVYHYSVNTTILVSNFTLSKNRGEFFIQYYDILPSWTEYLEFLCNTKLKCRSPNNTTSIYFSTQNKYLRINIPHLDKITLPKCLESTKSKENEKTNAFFTMKSKFQSRVQKKMMI